MKKIILSLLITASTFAADLNPKFVHALHMVESGGRVGKIVGDNGRALGPLQIHKSYWQDAVTFDKTIGGSYSDCTKLDYSIKIVTAYLNRYAQNAILSKDYQKLARIHNGGVKGNNKEATIEYWNKVNKYLK
jgi:hypothetical protein